MPLERSEKKQSGVGGRGHVFPTRGPLRQIEGDTVRSNAPISSAVRTLMAIGLQWLFTCCVRYFTGCAILELKKSSTANSRAAYL